MKRTPMAVERQLLSELREALDARGVTSVLIVDQCGKHALEVTDSRMRVRRVYVHLAFYWFLWGDGQEERFSCFRVTETAVRLTAQAADGWATPAPGDPQRVTNVLDSYSG